jgi:hypothetical protein
MTENPRGFSEPSATRLCPSSALCALRLGCVSPAETAGIDHRKATVGENVER